MSHKVSPQPSNRVRPSRDVVASMTALISLLAALAVLGIVKILGLPSDAVIVTCILLLPLFVYLIVSQRLTELSAPGGWAAKFVQAARESLRLPGLILPRSIAVHKEYQEPSGAELCQGPNSLKVILESKPIKFPICEYLSYVHKNLASGQVRYILVFQEPKVFYALIPATSISLQFYTSEGECKAYELIDWLYDYDSHSEQLGNLKGFVAREDAASMDWSKKRCFREMVDRNLEALPVVRGSQLIGIVEKTQLAMSILVDVLERLED